MDGDVYQAQMSDDFRPFRRDAHYLDAQELEIRPLIDLLEFIENKRYWGYKFRSGVFEISEQDFALIAQGMGIPYSQGMGIQNH